VHGRPRCTSLAGDGDTTSVHSTCVNVPACKSTCVSELSPFGVRRWSSGYHALPSSRTELTGTTPRHTSGPRSQVSHDEALGQMDDRFEWQNASPCLMKQRQHPTPRHRRHDIPRAAGVIAGVLRPTFSRRFGSWTTVSTVQSPTRPQGHHKVKSPEKKVISSSSISTEDPHARGDSG
jgi:hypothetical protein